MGYTYNQMINHFNNTVDLYKAFSLKESSCSNVNYIGDTLVSKDLTNGNVTIRVKLNKGINKPNGFKHEVSYFDLDADKFINSKFESSTHYRRYYRIDDNYFTVYADELKHAQDIRLDRWTQYILHNNSVTKLNVNKISGSLLKYIQKAVDKRIAGNNKNYVIKEVYFNYTKSARELVVVIKRNNYIATEAHYFTVSSKLS